MKLTKQTKEVLEIIKEKVSDGADATTIRLLYEKLYGKIGNVYDVLSGLVDEGLIVKLNLTYAITEMGVDILSDKKEKKELTPITFEKADIEAFEKFAKESDTLAILPRMLNPGLMGLEKERLGCLLAMVSPNDSFGDNNRISVLFEGPPGTAKTAIIKWAKNYLWGFWADYDSKKAALKGTASGYQCKPGLLVDANGNTIFIDEIDKMSQEDQSSLLGAMSSGIITINMDKVRNQSYPAEVRCVATCNNKQSLKAELFDRFDLSFVIHPLTREEKTIFVRRKLNGWGREKNGVSEADANFLKKYMEYAKTLNVDFPNNREAVINHVAHEVDTGKLQGKDARRIETSIKLCLAVARLRLHREVVEDDIKKALEMIA